MAMMHKHLNPLRRPEYALDERIGHSLGGALAPLDGAFYTLQFTRM